MSLGNAFVDSLMAELRAEEQDSKMTAVPGSAPKTLEGLDLTDPEYIPRVSPEARTIPTWRSSRGASMELDFEDTPPGGYRVNALVPAREPVVLRRAPWWRRLVAVLFRDLTNRLERARERREYASRLRRWRVEKLEWELGIGRFASEAGGGRRKPCPTPPCPPAVRISM